MNLLLIGFGKRRTARILETYAAAGEAVTHRIISDAAELKASLTSGTLWDVILANPLARQFNGREALKFLAADRRSNAPSFRQVPLLLLATGVRPERVADWSRQGASDYVDTERLARLVPATRRSLTRAAAETQRREAAIRHRAFSTHRGLEAFVIDHEGRYVFGNDSFCERVRAPLETILGKRWVDLLPAAPPGSSLNNWIERMEAENVQLFATGVPTQRVDVLPDAQGTLRNWLVTKFRFHGADGTYYVGGISINLGDLEPAVQRAEEMAMLLDIAHDAIFVRDVEGTIRFWNRGAEKVYGWTSAEAVGQQNLQLLFAPGAAEEWMRAQEIVLVQGEWSGQFHQITKSGQPVVVHSHWTLVSNFDGSPRQVLVVNTNVTERLRHEQLLQRSQRMEAVGKLATGLAHDFNNLMTPIIMASDWLLLDTVPAEEQRQALEAIRASAQRAADIVRSLLLFSKGLEGTKKNPTDVASVIREATHLVTRTLPKNIDFRSELPSSDSPLWSVSGDGAQISRAIMNLFSNGADALPQGGILRIRAKNRILSDEEARAFPDAKPGRYVVLSVSDTGVGIPENIQHLLFTPFFTTKDLSEGTGLGLANVYSIMKWHDGFVTVESKLGEGTKFCLYFPAEPPSSVELRLATAAKAAIPRGNGEWILIVDDEPTVRKVAEMTLNAYGYHVVTADNGADALQVYAANSAHIRAVLMDVNMPVMGGVQAMRELRKLDANLPMILLSGLTLPDELAGSTDPLDAVQAVLGKPYRAAALFAALKGALRPAH